MLTTVARPVKRYTRQNTPEAEARYWRRSACYGKNRYLTAGLATTSLHRHPTRGQSVTYCCPFCRRWHVAHLRPRRGHLTTYTVHWFDADTQSWMLWLRGVDKWGLRGPLRALHATGYDATQVWVATDE